MCRKVPGCACAGHSATLGTLHVAGQRADCAASSPCADVRAQSRQTHGQRSCKQLTAALRGTPWRHTCVCNVGNIHRVNAPADLTDCFHQTAQASLHSKRLRLWGTTQYPAAFSPSASHCLTVQPCGFAAVLAGSEGKVPACMVRRTRCESRGDRMAHA